MSKAEKKTTGKLILSVISLCFVVLMSYLGFWQLDRADQKERILEQWHQPAVLFEKVVLSNTEVFYQKVRITGVIDPKRYFFLDNRTRDGRVGYELISSLRLFQTGQDTKENEGAKRIFVNLGWLPASVDRNVLPKASLPTHRVEIEGWVKKVSGSIVLAEDHWSSEWPIRIQQVDVAKMAAVLSNATDDTHDSNNTVPFLFLAESSLLPSLLTQWKPTNMTVEKHIGYALQWFLMAFALLAMMVWFLMSEAATVSKASKRGVADEGAKS